MGKFSKIKGSALIVSLLVVSIVLLSELGIALTLLREKKASTGSNKSNQAMQIASGGIEASLQEILKGGKGKINEIYPDNCEESGLIEKDGYTVEFLDKEGNSISCDTNDYLYRIDKIKLVGINSGYRQEAEENVVFHPCDKQSTVKDDDDNEYPIVEIGNQCWMAENIRVGERIDGNKKQKDNGIIEKYCYDDKDEKCDSEGGLYLWDEAMQYSVDEGVQGICPAGWHIPTDEELHILEDYLKKDESESCNYDRIGFSCDNAGEKMMIGGESGFEWLIAGYKHTASGVFVSYSYNYFWSSTQWNIWDAYIRKLEVSKRTIHRSKVDKRYGFPIRCIKGNGEAPTGIPATKCSLPWGGDISIGDSVTAYLNSSVDCGETCSSEIRVCQVDGTLSGNFTNKECSVKTEKVTYGGIEYPEVSIGNQCWLGKNINIGTKILGTIKQTNNGVLEKYCYDNNESKCDEYGGLYRWDEAMQYATNEGVQGICPSGWHIPTDAEWHILISRFATSPCSPTLSGSGCSPAGTELQVGGSSGFNIKLGGYFWGGFLSEGTESFFWSSTLKFVDLSGEYNSYMRRFGPWSHIFRFAKEGFMGYSIRCIKN